ncbi:MAG: AbrB/MazE/SpoVT family DNA-binding domain-containing protein, partial [Thermoplasmata archaeon]
VSTKGQVTVPKDIRDALHIRAGDKLVFDLEAGDRALVRKAEPQRLTEILDRLGPAKETGVVLQRKLRRAWTRRDRRH